MSGALIVVLFTAVLIAGACLFLRGNRRPPTWPGEDPTLGLRDRERSWPSRLDRD